MKDILLSVPDKDYSFFMKLVKNLDFIEIKEPVYKKTKKQKLVDEFKVAVDELNQIKPGKLKGRPLQELLDEL